MVISGLTPGSQADYSCNPGYSLSGVETRICLDNGEWSEDAPSCIGKKTKSSISSVLSYTAHTAIVCPVLTDPANGDVSVTGQAPGVVATYTCRSGYTLEGVTVRTCQTTGIWSFEAPTCVGQSESHTHTHTEQ